MSPIGRSVAFWAISSEDGICAVKVLPSDEVTRLIIYQSAAAKNRDREQSSHIMSQMATEPTGSQAVDRAAELLVRIMESEQPPSVGELAAAAGLPKSTTSRLLRALESRGLVHGTAPAAASARLRAAALCPPRRPAGATSSS